MAQNFIACDREQELLLPPSLREWLAEDHLAWFVLDAVDAMDLKAFFAGYREDGWGRAAHDPSMMVALLVYAYAIGVRSALEAGQGDARLDPGYNDPVPSGATRPQRSRAPGRPRRPRSRAARP